MIPALRAFFINLDCHQSNLHTTYNTERRVSGKNCPHTQCFGLCISVSSKKEVLGKIGMALRCPDI